MKQRLVGRVRSGLDDCCFWLAKLEEHYRAKTGMTLFPGSLNVELPEPFSLPSQRMRLEGHEYGGRVSVNSRTGTSWRSRAEAIRRAAQQNCP